MDIIKAIRERRSVRKFTPDPVNDELINTILDAARWAPSWANTQCWRLIAVTEDPKRAAIAESIPPKNPASKAAEQAPVIMVICAETGKSGYYSGQASTDKGDWCMFDAGMATQNMALTAHSLGLGSVIVGIFDSTRVAQILGVPPNITVLALLPMGYPAEKPIAPRRKEIAEFVFRNQYQEH